MREINIFNRLFNRSPSITRLELVEDKGNSFFAWNNNLYKSDIIRACIRPKVKAIGKLIPQHVRNNSSEFKINPEVYIKFLLEEPNPYMTGQMFQEKMATQLALNNNAFAYILRDENGYATEMYNIPALSVEAIYDNHGYLFLKFTFRNGKIATYPYADIIHLRQDYNTNDIFGEPPKEALTSLMEIINTTDQGIIKAVRNSAVVKWLLKFNQALRDEDIKSKTKEFTDSFLNINNSGGAAGVDSKVDAKQVENKEYVPNAAQMDRAIQRVYSFFNTNEKIVQSKYSENEWNAYYESEIEPVSIQFSSELTRKIFTRRERGFGNRIIYTANNLQYASMSTKLNLVQMVDRGAMTPNEWREVTGVGGPIENGDKPIRRLDTAVVKGGE